MKKIILTAAALIALASCQFREEYFIDFSNVPDDPSVFQVTRSSLFDTSAGYPDSTTLPDGTPFNEYVADSLDTKANSTTMTNILQQLLKWGMQGKLLEIAGTYQSVDEQNNPITLSGKVVLPVGQEIKRIILVSHYTIGSDAEAPSNTFPLEAQLASMGYAMIFPDYIGYGVTSDRPHPYLMMEVTAKNVLDMYLAVKPFLKAIGREPKNDDIYLMGYSQGGGTTMAVLSTIEQRYSSGENAIKVKRVFAGGGIYDVKYTYESFLDTNWASYPCGVPFVLYGQVKGFHLPDSYMNEMIQPWLLEHLDDFFVQKRFSTKQMNKIINTHVTSEMLTPTAMDRTNYEVSTLLSMMTVNSVTSIAWTPEAPVYMMHSIDDDTVPYGNATRAKNRWPNANIQYNFGHYGGHVLCCLRFIYTVKTLLQEANE